MKVTQLPVQRLTGDLGGSPSLTPGRGESSAFISDLDSASENRAQSEPERLRESLGRLVGAAGCWVGMTTARLPGARRSGIRVGTHCAAGSKDTRGRKRVSHPFGNSRQAAPSCAPRSCKPEPGDAQKPVGKARRRFGAPHQRFGDHLLLYQLMHPAFHSPSRTATTTAAMTVGPRLLPPRSLRLQRHQGCRLSRRLPRS